MRPYLTVAEAVDVLRRSPPMIRRRCERGRYPGVFKDSGDWRIPWTVLIPQIEAPKTATKIDSAFERKLRHAMRKLW